MNDREKLIELIGTAPFEPVEGMVTTIGARFTLLFVGNIADHLLANGVTFAPENNVGSKWMPIPELPKEEECSEQKK